VSDAPAGDVALACVAAFVDELASSGLRHACISPGSRSTPIVLALERHPSVVVHVHLDERASAFFALGIAKATQMPVAVACTSGTAAAELLPAVVEAEMSRLPLLVLTADRPPEVRGTGANQSIDQRELYGRHVRAFVEAEVPGADAGAAAYWRTLAAGAADAALRRPASPVHVNLPFREPLTPTGADVSIGPAAAVAPKAPEPAPLAGAATKVIEEVAAALCDCERGVVIAGGLAPRPDVAEIAAVAERLGWPLLAEPTSQLRAPGAALAAGQLLLSNERFVADHRPEIVLQFGGAPTTRASQALSEACGRLIVVHEPGVPADPLRRGSPVLERGTDFDLAALGRGAPARDDWLAEWNTADARARRAVDLLLDGWDEPFEGRIARDVAASVPSGWTLFAGSSMPIRDLDAFMAPRDGLRILANRGASGIDGLVSTALGVAAAGTGTVALLGDLSLLHDAGSLLWSGRNDVDLTIVVANNDGGAIFSFLEQRRLPEHERLFTTPHGLDLGMLAKAARIPHARVSHASGVRQAVEAAAGGGIRMVEVSVDRALNVERHAEVHRIVAAALEPSR
jgi:2-succinyl-5-enolpyruvyl-6-hydroxy-3-cyclohexene-1-carboxylate synthase